MTYYYIRDNLVAISAFIFSTFQQPINICFFSFILFTVHGQKMKWAQSQGPMSFHAYLTLAGTSPNISYMLLYEKTQTYTLIPCTRIILCHAIMLFHAMQ